MNKEFDKAINYKTLAMNRHFALTKAKIWDASMEGRSSITNWKINSDSSDAYVKEKLEAEGFVVREYEIDWTYPTNS